MKRKIFPLDDCPFWEYSGRVLLTVDEVKKSFREGDRVLDVGGAPGNNLLRKHGIQNVSVLDLNPHADIVASADKIPISDNAYAFVTCLDTFEHIPQPARAKALSELVRVAQKNVILIAPQDSPENRRAEALVLQHRHDAFLVEHKQFGLLDTKKTEQQLQQMKQSGQIKDFVKSEIDNLLTWTCLMLEDFANASKIYQEAQYLENGFFARRAVYVISK